MSDQLKKLLKSYESKVKQFSSLRDSLEGELLSKLRLFDLRLRLALDMEVSFRGETSLTKTKEVRDTYAKFIKLVELWNASEALQHCAKALDKGYTAGSSPHKAYPKSLLEEVGSLSMLKDALNTLKEKYRKEKKFRTDFESFIQKITESENTKEPLKKICNSVKEYFDTTEDGKALSGEELIALIYAQRNMYYHDAEAAKMGMSYSSAQYLIDTLTQAFAQHLLLLASGILSKEYKARQGGE